MAEPAPLECRQLTRRFADVVAVDGLDLQVDPGCAMGFLGPNGAGKTTTLNMLVGLMRPTSGEARLFGVSPSEPAARQRIGFLPEQPVFYPDLSGLENLELLAELDGRGDSDRARALELLGLSDAALRRRVGTYSAGDVQKLGLVQAVQHHPDLVILDEPSSQLDALAREGFRALVTELVEDGRTVFLASHTLDEVQTTCDRVAVLRRGRLLLTSETGALAATALRRLTVRYSTPPAAMPAGVVEPRLAGNVLSAKLAAGRTDVLRALASDPCVDDVLVEPATLEEALLALYRRDDA